MRRQRGHCDLRSAVEAPGAGRPSEKFGPGNWEGLEGCLQEKQKKLYEDTGVT